MTVHTVTNRSFSIKSFFSKFNKRKAYLTLLEADFARQAIELQKLKRIIQEKLMRQADIA